MQTYFVLVRNREDSERPEDDGWWMDYLPHHRRMQVLEVADDEGISETEALLSLLRRDEQIETTVIAPKPQLAD